MPESRTGIGKFWIDRANTYKPVGTTCRDFKIVSKSHLPLCQKSRVVFWIIGSILAPGSTIVPENS